MKSIGLFFLLFLTFNGVAQNSNHNVQGATGYNRIGFYNELSYKFGVKQNYFKFGARHYTIDNFFETNAIGGSVDYMYHLNSKNDKFYFYPGASFTFFTENKSNAKIVLNDFKLINGVGYNAFKGFSVYYQMGFGIVDVKSKLTQIEKIVKINYFNYEMVFGINYRFSSATK